jgi:ectoine hydroxylase-related dioxygenase (phytanoyl-CoA dioxygenase family)
VFELNVSNDTSKFEVLASLDADGRLSQDCELRARKILDESGFVVIVDLISDAEAAEGLKLVRDSIADPAREPASFASQTDIRYARRDFCPLPSTSQVLSFSTLVCRRLEKILTEYCGRSRMVLEISTFTSYLGSSHQYIHRDPSGVLGIFVAVDDVLPSQGGTVFVPGTHIYSGAGTNYGGQAMLLMRLYQTYCNSRLLIYNLWNLCRMYRSGEPPISWTEFRERVFSRSYDNHQPNLLRFLLCKNPVFDLRKLGPRTLWQLLRFGNLARQSFRLVQTAPKQGTIFIYRSDMLHAGPDNRSERPRYFFNLSIARDLITTKQWHDGYTPHSTLLADPKSLSDLING